MIFIFSNIYVKAFGHIVQSVIMNMQILLSISEFDIRNDFFGINVGSLIEPIPFRDLVSSFVVMQVSINSISISVSSKMNYSSSLMIETSQSS